ncbi:MAG: SixA phosphatase family protein [Pyrinomonadaceae bacterium]|jgi:2,3-bisphosphoglycerate-dependent phosphoglycerate mutase
MIKNFYKLPAAALFLMGLLCVVPPAYGQKKLFILVRHAEKAEDAGNDPELTTAGSERARRLAKIIGKYRPGAVYSTAFRRTRSTAAPAASLRRLQVQTYDAKKPEDLIRDLIGSKTKRFLIVGHSNTIPGLANLLTGKELFKNLEDDEYGTIFLIRYKDGKFSRLEILKY